ncbi:hypothetical protein OROMI_018938 [Orobanche minor]
MMHPKCHSYVTFFDSCHPCLMKLFFATIYVPEKNAKGPNCSVAAKKKSESLVQKQTYHHKETHGLSDDIDANTPISEVKGPNMFERAKEEIEALIHTIHPKKDSGNVVSSTKKEGNFPISIGKGLEKICYPRGNNED